MRKVLIGLGLMASFSSGAQELTFVNKEVDMLTDSSFAGRGYVNDGSNKAAAYIAGRFAEMGLEPVNGDFYQKFNFEVNTFPNQPRFEVGGNLLKPGDDYICDPNSMGGEGTFLIVRLDSTDFQPKKPSPKTGKNVPVISLDGIDTPDEVSALHEFKMKHIRERPIVLLQPEKLTWSIGQSAYPCPIFEVLKGQFPAYAEEISFDVNPVQINYEAANLVGLIRGERSDSVMVVTAHYDHLGKFGDALFPGASDNASGVATLLDLADHFRKERPQFDMYFIAFAAEEAGLLGSKYFVDHPLFPLSSIRALLNIDLMGSAAKGIVVVNGRVFPDIASKLAAINREGNFVPAIRLRGKAANSDHYWFSESGVPAIFIYTEGNITAYHDVHDTPAVLDWENYPGLFHLLSQFLATY